MKEYPEGSDGGSDFFAVRSSNNINVYLQVKATRLVVDNNLTGTLKWYFSEKEVNKNRVLVCTFVYQTIEIDKVPRYVMIAGFLPREVVIERIRANNLKYVQGKKGYRYLCLNFQDLLHPSGLLAYLLMPEIDKICKQSTDLKQTRELGQFYLRSGFYQEALEQIKLSLGFQPNSYDALLDKSVCFFPIRTKQDLQP